MAECEWGLITGYDDKRKVYATLTHEGRVSKLKYGKLGKNGIDILSVAIPGEHNGRSRQEIVRKSLMMAVDHAEQREYIDRPDYQNGLVAFEMWAEVMDAGAMLADAGKLSRCGDDALMFAEYYAGCFYGARCYARDYLTVIADGDKHLDKAAACYEEVATCLQPAWKCFAKKRWPAAETFRELGQSVRDAKGAEKEAVALIKTYLNLDT